MKEVNFIGAKAHLMSSIETVEVIRSRLDRGIFTQHSVVNVAKIVNMQNDVALADSVNSCHIVNIDGMGVVWGARLCGHDVPERVAGVDLFHELLKSAAKSHFPVFLLGATDEVVSKTAATLAGLYPGLKIAGFHHGYFWDDEEAIVKKIADSGARLLFVAITSPKKENFINKWKDQLGVDFVMGVGGTFDVVAGKVKRAPVWMQNAGLEWFYRVLQEPGRMWKRYAVTNSKYLLLLAKEFWKVRVVKQRV
ncbi:WecB/TagA/CpsF family glycosyltransferase [Vogesella mureinivorans]|uniref:WecB/TagA/CpsF family glycosyltransferase n=1 Tax=Vogesella mureinivorans TaxID=657276 RepID=UPI0014791935|nr:WecB/TagA/CpsF family glycosyltransferase [Vogesella mureinivorans]